MTTSPVSIEQLAINTIRTLSMDGVQKANSGHPGTPMALAPVVYQLWNHHLRFDPAQPDWPGRDRFILSCGHASMLLYSILHLADVRGGDKLRQPTRHSRITLDDIKNFRQWKSPCPGHPELGDAPGIEMTTGPLGQGIGSSVGMAAAAGWMAARYDRPGFDLFGFNVYALCSDGDLMEGLGCEAASLAGHLKLSNLCWIYDDNHITIEGNTSLAFSEDVGQRFESLGWHVIHVDDANNLAAIDEALTDFQNTADRPTIIIVRSIIAFGAPNKADTAGAHGSPLGDDEIRLTKEAYGWPTDQTFLVPDEVRQHFAAGIGMRGEAVREEWEAKLAEYESQYETESAALKNIWEGTLPEGWDADIPTFEANEKGLATRASSGEVINAVAARLPWFLGGSADLAPSTITLLKMEDAGHFEAGNRGGRNFHFGVREHVMGAICNGLSLCGLLPYAGTFFSFTDYMRPSMRLASIMHRGVIYVMTHDSIGLGEDGPTHQPIEHLAACRAIPGLDVVRPADANEVAEAYREAISISDHPVTMVLTRQALPTVDRDQFAPASGTRRGAYVLADSDRSPEVILLGTGSEVSICMAAHAELAAAGIGSRVVSMPCWEWFEKQEASYRESVLPQAVTARVAVEAGVVQGWEKYIGPRGRFIGMTGFGGSAPAAELYKQFGITPKAVVAAAKELLGR